MKKIIFILLALIISASIYAHDIEVKNADGVTIYYNYFNNGTELEVTFRGYSRDSYSKEYQGNVVIPEEVTYMNRIRKVTSIGKDAFADCYHLTSVTIPNSVTEIGNNAFYGSDLTSVTIPNSVTSIGGGAFYWCPRLTSVTIPNSVTVIDDYVFYCCYCLTSVTIPNSVTSIGDYAFSSCKGLTSITIPNSVTSIGGGAFQDCSGLTSVTIPNSVTKIGNNAFSGCSGLKSVTIPNSVTVIDDYVFAGCSGLTSVTIPNSVTSIGFDAFSGCSGLKSVTIPNSVTKIGNNAFYCSGLNSVTIPNSVTSIGYEAFGGCSGLTSVTIGNSVTSIGGHAFEGADISTVISLIKNPFSIEGKKSSSSTFSQNTFFNATLYVPKGTIDKYKATEGWKDFVFIEEGEGPGGETPQIQKCATPTISYQNGKLTFGCATEGATCQYSISDTDIKTGSGNEVQLNVTYNISVYATKEGYENSETATATLCWIDAEPWAEGTKEAEDNVTEVKAIPILIQTEGNIISVQGAAEGTDISVYNTAGIILNSAIAKNGITTLNTTLQSGSTAIVKIGEKSVKVLVK